MQRSTTVRALLLAGTAVLAAAVPASAVTTVTSVNGLNWQIHDIAPPKLDTRSENFRPAGHTFSGAGLEGSPAVKRSAKRSQATEAADAVRS